MSDAPPPRPFPHAAGHPANHGYAACAHCGVQRSLANLGPVSRACLYGCGPQTVTGNHLAAPEAPDAKP